MSGTVRLLEVEILEALSAVTDPELDESITDLGFVRSVAVDDDGVTVHLRLPTAFCLPDVAYLMASDARDALREVEGIGQVRVLLDEHYDGAEINAGLAGAADDADSFAAGAEHRLEELRRRYLREAHSAAMERCVSALMQREALDIGDVPRLTLRNLPDDQAKHALLRRRLALGLSMCSNARVAVDGEGKPLPLEQLSASLRLARSVRISMEGSARFCRDSLAGRDDYAGSRVRVTDTRTGSRQR
ncbi:metal-sulfur cluster assembly factor [Mycobacterium sp. HUMS_1102779]|uniref:metal-sulfur cluster assembly factor n=1 Tax=Mycobacterium sp. HUMS_1102779 TaxID=3383487 RepID=UPI00389A917A